MTRTWTWVQSPTGRESAFTRMMHVVVELDPYSGFGKTACGRESRGGWGEKDDADLAHAEELDGLTFELCPRCSAATETT